MRLFFKVFENNMQWRNKKQMKLRLGARVDFGFRS